MGLILYLPLRMLTASPISYVSCIYLPVNTIVFFSCYCVVVICTLLPLYVLIIVSHHTTCDVSTGCASCGACPSPGACPFPGLPFIWPALHWVCPSPNLPSSGRLSWATLPRACPLSGLPSSVRPSPGRNSTGLPFHGLTFPRPPFPGAAFCLPFLYRDRIVPSRDRLFARHLLTTRSLFVAPVAGSPFFGMVCLP